MRRKSCGVCKCPQRAQIRECALYMDHRNKSPRRVSIREATFVTEVTMARTLNWRTARIAVLAAAVAIPLGSVAWGRPAAQYGYDDRHDEAREHGYRNGFRDGSNAGQYDRDRGRRFKFKNDDWEDSRGFEHW